MNTYEDNTEHNVMDEIKAVKQLYDIQHEKVKTEQYIEQLMFQDYVRKIKKPKHIFDYSSKHIQMAFNQQHEKKKADRPQFEYVQDLISDTFFSGDKIKIVEIICGGYEGYYYAFKVEHNRYLYYIAIPILDAINTANVHYAYDGMINCGYYESEGYIRTITTSYVTEDIAEAIKAYEAKEKT